MKQTASIAFALSVFAALVITNGCGLRVEIAKEKVLERIDSALGNMDVKRKEVEVSVGALKDALTELRKAKIKAKVNQDQIDRKIRISDGDILRFDSTLRNLRNELTSNSIIAINGRTYTASEMSQLTQRVLREREAAIKQRNGFQTAKDRLNNVVAMLERKHSEHETQLANIEHQLTAIDSNRVTLNAMQDAAESMDGSEQSFSLNVEKLEDQVNDLYADVQAGLLAEDNLWTSETTLASVDQIVSVMQSPDDLVDEIDSVLSETQVVDSAW